MGLTRYPETSVNNYHTTPRNIPEELKSFPFLLGLLTRENGTDTLSRNVGKQLPHVAA
jgi:hypothetical protein